MPQNRLDLRSRLLILVGSVLMSITSACAHSSSELAHPLRKAAEHGKPVSAEELLRAGEQLMRQGQSVRAEHYLAAALEQGASKDRVIPLLVAACLEGSRLRAALEHAEPYLRVHPEEIELRFVVAATHVGLNRLDRARAMLEEVVRMRPADARARYVLGSLLAWQLEEAEGARFHFLRYLELDPNGHHSAEVRSWLRERARFRDAFPSDERSEEDDPA